MESGLKSIVNMSLANESSAIEGMIKKSSPRSSYQSEVMKKRWSENREAMLEIVKRARKASVESIKLFGRKPNSAESIARMAATKRLRCDQAERERLSKVQKKLWSDPKYRAKMSFVHLGKTLSEAAKKKLSLFHKGKTVFIPILANCCSLYFLRSSKKISPKIAYSTLCPLRILKCKSMDFS